MRFAIAFLLLLVPLGGCLDSVLDADEAGWTAMEAREAADARARAWDADAELVLVQGGESRNETRDGQAPREVFADGRPQRTSFYYRAPGQDAAWNVTVGGDGRILSEDPETVDSEPLTDWNVDSSEMVDVLRRDAEGFADRVDGGETEDLFYVVGRGFDDDLGTNETVWVVLEDADELYIHVVHAGNGTLLHSEPFTLTFGLESSERGSFSGTLTAVAPFVVHFFSTSAAHDHMDVGLTADAAAPGDSVTLNVTAPDGTSTEETLASPLPGEELTFRIEPAPAGAWTFDVVLDGVAVDYTVRYCTSGIAISFQDPFEAGCPRVDS